MIIFTPETGVVFTGRDDSFSDPLVIRETWLENVYRITREDMADTGVLIDLGANIGAVSVWGARMGKRVIAVEPEIDNLRLLTTNLHANLFDPESFIIFPVACTPESKIIHLEPDHGHSQVVESPTPTSVEVEGITLAEVHLRAGVPYADVLKIDIEGGEYPLIAATPLEILRKSKFITLEFDAAPDAVFGSLVAKLAHEFSIEILGSPERGGYLYARRYDDV